MQPEQKQKIWTGIIITILIAATAGVFFMVTQLQNKQTPKTTETAGTTTQNNSTAPKTDIPTAGPYVHKVYTATSTDGLVWTSNNTPIVEHASVPAIIQTDDGIIHVYYVDASKIGGNTTEGLGCVESTDNGLTFTTEICAIEGLSSIKAVDYSIVALTDGRLRLYYYASAQNTDTKEDHNINSAISTDGRIFTEEGTVFTYNGMVDPDIFWNGKEWVMHVFSLTDNATVIATSSDGTEFTYKGTLSPAGYGVTKPVQLSDGTFRMYGFSQKDSLTFVSFASPDGLTWTQEEGTRLSAPDSYEITDPSVVLLENGTYLMAYKVGPKKPSAR